MKKIIKTLLISIIAILLTAGTAQAITLWYLDGTTLKPVDATWGIGVATTLITVTDESADTTCFPLFATAATGSLGAKSGSNITFNSNTGMLTASGFTGALTGNATTVTNATLTTALTVNTGTLTLTANGANSSVLTIGAGAVSVSGANTGDNAANSSSTYIGTTAVALNRASAALTLAGITLTSPTLTTPALGTPGSGTLTSCSGLPLTGLVDDTSTALGVGTLELGHASDTTLSRSAAGVLAVEGVVIPSISSTNTFTNKRITPRVSTEASSATPTINTDNVDAHSITALAAAITSFTTNLSGTPTNFQKLTIRILDNGTARAIAFGTSFQAMGVALPTTTTISKVLTIGFIWDSVDSKFGCVAVSEEE